jgi:hypothetical protein
MRKSDLPPLSDSSLAPWQDISGKPGLGTSHYAVSVEGPFGRKIWGSEDRVPVCQIFVSIVDTSPGLLETDQLFYSDARFEQELV